MSSVRVGEFACLSLLDASQKASPALGEGLVFMCWGPYSQPAGLLLVPEAVLHHAWGLVSQPGVEPGPPKVGAQSLNHWTTRESPTALLCNISILMFHL